MALTKNLFVDQYSNWEKTLTLYDQNHNPFDLTNYTASCHIRKYTNTSKIAEIQCEVLNPPTLGKILLSLSYEDLLDIKAGIYQYDILLISSDDVKIRALQGNIDISGNITNGNS